jgi:hypothetical protein
MKKMFMLCKQGNFVKKQIHELQILISVLRRQYLDVCVYFDLERCLYHLARLS